MSNKTKSALKLIAIVLVIAAVLMELSIVVIPAIVAYKFWMVVIGFALTIISSR